MPRYFIDLRNKGGMARDEEGTEFAHLEDALTEAKHSARDLVRQFIDDRTPLGETCVEVRDTNGHVVAVLTVAEVLEHPIHPAFKNTCAESHALVTGSRVKIATYNVNGVNGRFPVLLRWLEQAQPDIVCLQELKSPQEKFPKDALEKAGYGAIWDGQKSWNGVAILARGADPVETRRGLPGDPDDVQSRYIEAAVKGLIVGCLYMPNGNPAPGPKFDYKLAWFKRLHKYAGTLLKSGHPVVMAGDYNVMPTDLDVYKPERWLDDALFRPEVRKAYAALAKQGWTDALRTLHPDERIYTFWDYFRNAYARNAGLRIDHLLLTPDLAKRLERAEVDMDVRGWEKTSDHAPVWIELKGARAKK